MMRNIIFRPFIIMLVIGISFLGAFSALKFGRIIDQSPWGLCILLIFDISFILAGYRIKKNNVQLIITNLSDYRIFAIFLGAFCVGFGAVVIALTMSGIVFILTTLI